MSPCLVPGCERPTGAEWQFDLCDQHLQVERYALAQFEDVRLLELDALDGGDRFDREVWPPPPRPTPMLPANPGWGWTDPDGSRYGLRAFEGIMADLHDQAVEGNYNNAFARAAKDIGALVGGGELREAPARRALHWCLEQLGRANREYLTLIDRRIRQGKECPRVAPAQTRRAA